MRVFENTIKKEKKKERKKERKAKVSVAKEGK
jgi:hypothetical protein